MDDNQFSKILIVQITLNYNSDILHNLKSLDGIFFGRLKGYILINYYSYNTLYSFDYRCSYMQFTTMRVVSR